MSRGELGVLGMAGAGELVEPLEKELLECGAHARSLPSIDLVDGLCSLSALVFHRSHQQPPAPAE
jgi:hypothetical protein